MTRPPTRRFGGSSWWIWMLVAALGVAVLWAGLAHDDRGRTTTTTTTATTAMADVTPAPPAADASSVREAPALPAASVAASGTPTAMSKPVREPAVYATTSDKLSLVDRPVVFDAVEVVRIVGPRSFTVASGDTELIITLAPGVDGGVGTRGDIDVGTTVRVSGIFRRLDENAIDTLSDRRVRALTDAERRALRKTPVYVVASSATRRDRP